MLWSTLIGIIPSKKNKLKYANNKLISDQVLQNKNNSNVSAEDKNEYEKLSAILDDREHNKSAFQKKTSDFIYHLCNAIYKVATRNWPTDPKDVR